jgi:hypothetical protein
MKIWSCEKSPRICFPNVWTRMKNVNHLRKFWNFFRLYASKIISCPDWWPRTKPGNTTMTHRQNNNQRSGSISAHPARPKNS